MPWATIVPLLIQYGLPAVQFIVGEFEKGNDATSATLQQVAAMAQQTAKDKLMAILAAQKIDPTSPQGIALLALVS